MTDILNLEPKRLWYYFDEICKVPHGTYNEAPLREYLIKFAKDKRLEYRVDGGENIVIRKGASPKCKSARPIVLQGHLDMVCVKEEGLAHDFKKDPIKPRVDGDYVKAAGTTLGADNGIATAAALAFLEDDSLAHGPIECLFTASEEEGMLGALKLESDMLKGRTMLNMDSEDPEHIVYIGCAGGAYSDVRFPVKKQPLPNGYIGISVEISGLRGGHSGVDIHEQRGNATKILARFFGDIRKEYDVVLAELKAGTAANVIPNLATAKAAVKNSDIGKVEELVRRLTAQYKAELEVIDPGLAINLKKDGVKEVLDKGLSDRIIDYTNAAPNGVVTMSYDIKGLVQTSTNIGVVCLDDSDILFTHLTRSSVASECRDVCEKIASLARLAGVKAKITKSYPGWKPNLKSPILNLTKKIVKDLFEREAELKAIHAGLECGVIQEKFPGMDCLSLSTDLTGAHSVNEKIRISSVANFWKLLRKIIEEFAKG